MIGKKLKKIRLQKGLTLTELSKMCLCDRSTLSYYECDKRTPGIKIATKLADVLDLDLKFFAQNCHSRDGKTKKNIQIENNRNKQSEPTRKKEQKNKANEEENKPSVAAESFEKQ